MAGCSRGRMRRGNVAGFVFDWLTEEWTVGERRNSGQPELQPSGESGPNFSPDFMARSRKRSSGKKYGALWHYRRDVQAAPHLVQSHETRARALQPQRKLEGALPFGWQRPGHGSFHTHPVEGTLQRPSKRIKEITSPATASRSASHPSTGSH